MSEEKKSAKLHKCNHWSQLMEWTIFDAWKMMEALNWSIWIEKIFVEIIGFSDDRKRLSFRKQSTAICKLFLFVLNRKFCGFPLIFTVLWHITWVFAVYVIPLRKWQRKEMSRAKKSVGISICRWNEVDTLPVCLSCVCILCSRRKNVLAITRPS